MSPGYEYSMHVGKRYITVHNKQKTVGEMKPWSLFQLSTEHPTMQSSTHVIPRIQIAITCNDYIRVNFNVNVMERVYSE